MSKVKVSAVLSIHNRSKLFRRALDGYLTQTLPREEWEIVLVDDMSTERLSDTYAHLIGKINLTHIRMDHTMHPIYREMNPLGAAAGPKNWFHTPALSTNLGVYMAKGDVICLCHPEILHAPTNFERALETLASEKRYLFGKTFIGTAQMNEFLSGNPDWTAEPWEEVAAWAASESSAVLDDGQLYWYTSFLPKAAVEAVRGVDFEYLRGVAAEDDDFRDRVYAAGWEPTYRRDLIGIHQYHEDEKESHRRRDSDAWKRGLETNRKTYGNRKKSGFPRVSNSGYWWDAREALVEYATYRIGSSVKETVVA